MNSSGYKRPGSPVTWRWLWSGVVLTLVSFGVVFGGAPPVVMALFLALAGLCYVIGGFRMRRELGLGRPPASN